MIKTIIIEILWAIPAAILFMVALDARSRKERLGCNFEAMDFIEPEDFERGGCEFTALSPESEHSNDGSLSGATGENLGREKL